MNLLVFKSHCPILSTKSPVDRVPVREFLWATELVTRYYGTSLPVPEDKIRMLPYVGAVLLLKVRIVALQVILLDKFPALQPALPLPVFLPRIIHRRHQVCRKTVLHGICMFFFHPFASSLCSTFPCEPQDRRPSDKTTYIGYSRKNKRAFIRPKARIDALFP